MMRPDLLLARRPTRAVRGVELDMDARLPID
jgi:hypothetical protein